MRLVIIEGKTKDVREAAESMVDSGVSEGYCEYTPTFDEWKAYKDMQLQQGVPPSRLGEGVIVVERRDEIDLQIINDASEVLHLKATWFKREAQS